MTTPTQQLRSRALGSPSVSVGTAQMVCALLDIIEKQQAQLDRLQGIVDNQADRIRAIGQGLQRANGVHGA